MFEKVPLRRVEEHSLAPLPRNVWPATVPAVRQLLDDGLDLAPLTILVGENGSGKSTVMEAIAEAFGLGVEGGDSQRTAQYATDRITALGTYPAGPWDGQPEGRLPPRRDDARTLHLS